MRGERSLLRSCPVAVPKPPHKHSDEPYGQQTRQASRGIQQDILYLRAATIGQKLDALVDHSHDQSTAQRLAPAEYTALLFHQQQRARQDAQRAVLTEVRQLAHQMIGHVSLPHKQL